MRRTTPFEQAYLDARKHLRPRRVAGRWTIRTRVGARSFTVHGASAESTTVRAAMRVAAEKMRTH